MVEPCAHVGNICACEYLRFGDMNIIEPWATRRALCARWNAMRSVELCALWSSAHCGVLCTTKPWRQNLWQIEDTTGHNMVWTLLMNCYDDISFQNKHFTHSLCYEFYARQAIVSKKATHRQDRTTCTSTNAPCWMQLDITDGVLLCFNWLMFDEPNFIMICILVCKNCFYIYHTFYISDNYYGFLV